MISSGKLRWCAYSLFGLFMVVIVITVSGTLLRGKQFVWNLQQMDREEAQAIIINKYYSQYDSITVELGLEFANEAVLAMNEAVLVMADGLLDRTISSLAPWEKVILDINSSEAFDISDRVVTLSCIVFLVWLVLWRTRGME